MIKDISIVIPIYNEENNIEDLYAELKENTKNLNAEIIFIDDGSTDNSWDKIKEIAKKENIKAIKLSRNYGQTAALKAGIDIASKEFILTMDGDLQNDPSDIKNLIVAMTDDCDLVSGWRRNRKDKFFTRILPSKIANFIISYITGIKLKDYGCTLKLYRASFLKDIELFGEMHRFIPALISYKGGKIKEIEVNHRPRLKGKSKYGLERTFKILIDIITVKFMGEFILKPLYLFGGISIFLGLISIGLALITLYNKLYNHIFVKDQPLFLVAIFIALAGIQIGLIGILSEIVVRTYYLSSRKSYFNIKERICQIQKENIPVREEIKEEPKTGNWK